MTISCKATIYFTVTRRWFYRPVAWLFLSMAFLAVLFGRDRDATANWAASQIIKYGMILHPHVRWDTGGESGWISVEDAIPEDGESCFVRCEVWKGCLIGERWNGEWVGRVGGWRTGAIPVTHWRPMRERPGA